MTKTYIELNHRHLTYQLSSTDFKETLVFVHGAGSSLEQFKYQYDFFKSQYNVLCISLHGHDQTYATMQYNKEEFAIPRLAEDVCQILQQLNLSHIHFVGNSLGGLVGYQLYLTHPESCKSLTTFGTAIKLTYPRWAISLISKIDLLMLTFISTSYLSSLLKASSNHIHTQKKMLEIMLEVKHVAHLVRSQIGNYDFLHLLDHLSIPYLYLHCTQDDSINKAMKPHFSYLENSSTVTIKQIEKAGHFCNLDQPELFNQTLLNFIHQAY